MIKLAQTDPLARMRLPLAFSGCTLRAVAPVPITSLAPYPGQCAGVQALLGGFPKPGEVLSLPGVLLVWAGRDLAFAFGAELPDGLAAYCAMSDQSDGWCGLELQGPQASEYLARHVPFDLRAMPVPGAARTVLKHVPVLIVRKQDGAFELWVWRSMAHSALNALAPG